MSDPQVDRRLSLIEHKGQSDADKRVAGYCKWCRSPVWRIYHGKTRNHTLEPRTSTDPADLHRGAVAAERERIIERIRHMASVSLPDDVSRTALTIEKVATVLAYEWGQ